MLRRGWDVNQGQWCEGKRRLDDEWAGARGIVGMHTPSTSAGLLASGSLTSGRLHSQLQLTPYLFPLTFIWFSPGALSNCSLWLLDTSSADSYWMPDVWACFSWLPFSLCPWIFSSTSVTFPLAREMINEFKTLLRISSVWAKNSLCTGNSNLLSGKHVQWYHKQDLKWYA